MDQLTALPDDEEEDEEDTSSERTAKPDAKKKKDLYVLESGKILADWVLLAQEEGLAGAKKKKK
jgi:carboxyl-terminal processing protease